MPIQSTDTTSPIVFDSSSQTWVIKQGVVVAVGGFSVYAVQVNNAVDTLLNYGSIASASSAVVVSGAGNDQVTNAASGVIQGNIGLHLGHTLDVNVDNAGTITAMSYGVDAVNSTGTIYNTGLIQGHLNGIAEPSAALTIENLGQIVGGQAAIDLLGASLGTTVIDNQGRIAGGLDSASIMAETGSDAAVHLANSGTLVGRFDLSLGTGAGSVVNTGQIQGAVLFAATADLYDGRGGTVSGAVLGGGGNDTLIGGLGDETLVGGLGRDKLDGGKAGEDVFRFDDIKDSRASAPDIIAKHWAGGDLIDLSALDANTHSGGTQHLVFGGEVAAGASLAAGTVDFYKQGGDTYVVFDNTGDGQADFKLQIHGTFSLTAGEFAV